MKAPSIGQVELIAIGLGVAVVGVLLWRFGGKAAEVAGGIVTGNNALTENATNAAGERVDAYQGAGVVGTAGAAANAASGGVFASVGEWIGGKVFEWTHDDPMAQVNRPAPAPAPAVPSIDWGYGTTW